MSILSKGNTKKMLVWSNGHEEPHLNMPQNVNTLESQNAIFTPLMKDQTEFRKQKPVCRGAPQIGATPLVISQCFPTQFLESLYLPCFIWFRSSQIKPN